jgi:hypothetical protein
MDKVMLQFHSTGNPPSLDDVKRLFGLNADEIDAEFGVIASSPDDGLFTVLIGNNAEAKVNAALARRPKRVGEGVFSNPRIEPFGLPER